MINRHTSNSIHSVLKVMLIALITCTSFQIQSQSNWVYFLTSENGRKFEVDTSSITKIGNAISFSLRYKEPSNTLMSVFQDKDSHIIHGVVVSCSEPLAFTYSSKEVNSKGDISNVKEVTSAENAVHMMKPIASNAVGVVISKRYCNQNLNSMVLSTNKSAITDKSPGNVSDWSFINVSEDKTFSYLIDVDSIRKISSSKFQVTTNTRYSNPKSDDYVKNYTSIIALNGYDCANKSLNGPYVEYFDSNNKLILKAGDVNIATPFVSITQNAMGNVVLARYCSKIAEMPLKNSDTPLKTQQEKVITQQNEIPASLAVSIVQAQIPSQSLPNLPVGKRLALVIGNASYKVRPLLNPRNDADDVSRVLRSSGFEVIDLRDATLSQMRISIRQFGDKLLTSDVGLVYYSGHGVEVKGQNYLIPVNADIRRSDEVSDQSINMGLILEKMETAQKGVNILIVDACRDDPFGRSFRSNSRGLATMDAPQGTIIAFATSPGKVAADGEGRNSPYTKNLIKTMQIPNLPIEQVFKQVRRAVQQETKNQQTPWENTSLSGDFYFSVKK